MRNIPQHAWDLLNCLNTHHSFKLIMDMSQLEWIYFNGLDIHFLYFKLIRYKI